MRSCSSPPRGFSAHAESQFAFGYEVFHRLRDIHKPAAPANLPSWQIRGKHCPIEALRRVRRHVLCEHERAIEVADVG